jgi:hypothetical protein
LIFRIQIHNPVPEVRQTESFVRWLTGLRPPGSGTHSGSHRSDGNPEFAAVLKVMRALGLRLKVVV